MKPERDPSWLKDRRVRWAAAGCLLAGFLLGMLVFGAPWHLPANWGDIPTWLLVLLAAIAAWVGFDQLRILRGQVKEEADRNVRRDELLDSQLEEAKARTRSDRRKQAEGVKVRHKDGAADVSGFVDNESPRPITDVTCKVMSMADGTVIAVPDMRGESFVTTGTFAGAVQPRTLEIAPDEQPGERYLNLLPGRHCRFTFDGLHVDPDHIVVAWFTDDAGFRWQLDEHLHLAETKGDAYVA